MHTETPQTIILELDSTTEYWYSVTQEVFWRGFQLLCSLISMQHLHCASIEHLTQFMQFCN